MSEELSTPQIDSPKASPVGYNRQFLFDAPLAYAQQQAKPSKSTRIKNFVKNQSVVTTIAMGALLGGVAGGGVGIAAYNFISAPGAIVINNVDSVNWVTAAAAKASPSVVTISVSSGTSGGSGSGVILTDDGYILTNTHVVTLDGETADPSIEVKTTDGHVYSATLVGTDPTNDLAVVKVSASVTFVPATFADSSKLNVGDSVVAIGAPLGLETTVTKGILSALNRTIQVASAAAPDSANGQGGLQLWNGSTSAAPINLSVVQTDAAINPGNSGGALVNERGEIVGINVAIATAGSNTEGQAGSIGVGFAIPSNIAMRIADEIMKTGSASHALLGAMVSDATKSSGTASFSVGAKIEELTKGGPAEKAGLEAGDIVTKFNGQVIESSSQLTAAVRQLPANSKAQIEVTRDGKTVTIDVQLGNASDLK